MSRNIIYGLKYKTYTATRNTSRALNHKIPQPVPIIPQPVNYISRQYPKIISQKHLNLKIISQKYLNPKIISQKHLNPKIISQKYLNPKIIPLAVSKSQNTVSKSQNYITKTFKSQNETSSFLKSQNTATRLNYTATRNITKYLYRNP